MLTSWNITINVNKDYLESKSKVRKMLFKQHSNRDMKHCKLLVPCTMFLKHKGVSWVVCSKRSTNNKDWELFEFRMDTVNTGYIIHNKQF